MDVAFKLFKFEFVAYTVKSGLFIMVLVQSDWKLVGLPTIFEYCKLVKPVPLPYKYWFESIVNAGVLFVNKIIVFAVELYIPLVPLKVISGAFMLPYVYVMVGI